MFELGRTQHWYFVARMMSVQLSVGTLCGKLEWLLAVVEL